MKDFNSIPDFVNKTNKEFIQNNYIIVNPEHYDFGIVIYFLNSNKAQIIIRQFDVHNGWNHDLIIKIYSSKNNQEFDIIHLGSSIQNYKKCNVYTQTKLLSKTHKILKIPQKIVQTYFQNEFHNDSHKQAFHHLLELHPQFDYEFFNDTKVVDFIRKYYEKYLKYYFSLYPSAYKADLFRYLYIYHYGGFYLDHKYIIRKSFSDILDENSEQLFCTDTNPQLLFNSIIVSCPKNPSLLNIVEQIKKNIKNKFYGNCPLHPTGPRLFGEFMDHSYSKLVHKINEKINDYKKGNVFIRDDNQELFLTTSYTNYYFNKNHRNQVKNDYDFCYHQKKVYLQNILLLDDYVYCLNLTQKVNMQIIFLEKTTTYITIQTIFQGILENEINHKHLFIVYDLNNDKNIEYPLNKCFNKIVEIHF